MNVRRQEELELHVLGGEDFTFFIRQHISYFGGHLQSYRSLISASLYDRRTLSHQLDVRAIFFASNLLLLKMGSQG